MASTSAWNAGTIYLVDQKSEAWLKAHTLYVGHLSSLHDKRQLYDTPASYMAPGSCWPFSIRKFCILWRYFDSLRSRIYLFEMRVRNASLTRKYMHIRDHWQFSPLSCTMRTASTNNVSNEITTLLPPNHFQISMEQSLQQVRHRLVAKYFRLG